MEAYMEGMDLILDRLSKHIAVSVETKACERYMVNCLMQEMLVAANAGSFTPPQPLPLSEALKSVENEPWPCSTDSWLRGVIPLENFPEPHSISVDTLDFSHFEEVKDMSDPNPSSRAKHVVANDTREKVASVVSKKETTTEPTSHKHRLQKIKRRAVKQSV